MTTPLSTNSSVDQRKPSRLAWILFAIFALSMVMGTGPGILLVNKPDSIFGIPLVYAWGILWYVVQVAVGLVAYFTLWRKSDQSDEQTEEVAQ